ncbi:restriction endonuclease subunit S [Phocaeicola coprocola]|uniref:restriction endonuclease subunit S n=1 Tax=Phocaeicola coprocola TaxID=310298 RepID=UPI001DCA65DD|nr:restriction endonuclease subunit S [Phocaeicola coprocola]MBM6712476.1 restriction endonuclease subunit S [Phocaeicola coprocola]
MGKIKTYKLGDIVNVLDYKRIPLSSTQRQNKKGIYPYYGAQGIIDYIDDYIFDGEYLLIAEDGENLKSQKQHVAQIAKGKYWVNNHAHIVESNGLCDIRYVCYLLNRMDLSGYITGSAQPKLNQANLLKIEIKLPSLKEQYKIAEFLHLFDDKIEINRRINENLEQQAQALFKSWFVDFEPFQDGKFVNSELGMIPEGWKVGTLSDIIKNTISGDWGKEHPQGNHIRKVFCIRGADIPDIKIGNKGNMPTRFILEKNYQSKVLIDGDMVIEVSGGSPTQSTGRACRISNRLLDKYNNSIICTNFCKAIKPLSGYSSFLYYIWEMLYNQGVMFSYENGTTGIKNLDINGFIQKEQIIIPPIHIATDFEKMIKVFYDKIQSNGMQSERLAQLRDTLLPKLMSGELKINDFNN